MAKNDTETQTGERVITPKARLSYAYLFEPDQKGKFSDGKYKATFLFDPSDKAVEAGLTTMKKAALAVARAAFGEKTKLSEIQHPFRDGSEKAEENPEYKGMIFVTARTKFRPGVIDQKKNPVETDDTVYSGCYVRASLVPFSYVQGKDKGVSFRLCNVQKMADGESLGVPRIDPADEFESVSSADVDEKTPFKDADDDDGLGI